MTPRERDLWAEMAERDREMEELHLRRRELELRHDPVMTIEVLGAERARRIFDADDPRDTLYPFDLTGDDVAGLAMRADPSLTKEIY